MPVGGLPRFALLCTALALIEALLRTEDRELLLDLRAFLVVRTFEMASRGSQMPF